MQTESESSTKKESPPKSSESDFTDRQIKHVPTPETKLLSIKDTFDANGQVKLDLLQTHLSREGRLEKSCALKLIRTAKGIFRKEPNLLRLEGNLSVCGDIHGQYYDLLRIFEVGGSPPDVTYLFLGDYVDRGCFSSEVLWLLIALKINLPEKMWMLRGNHECRRMTEFFNFKRECEYKYNIEIYDEVMLLFDCLPLAALVGSKYFCVHAGLSPDIRYIKDIDKIDRFQEIPKSGPMCDLLWSDPSTASDDPTPKSKQKWFRFNKRRGISYVYGKDAVKIFIRSNKIKSIIRGHSVEKNGYYMHFQKTKRHFPKVITVFSAPDYCDIYNNDGALVEISDGLVDVLTFKSSPHPYYLPKFKDVFSWSLPYIATKVTQILECMLKKSVDVMENQANNEKSCQKSVSIRRNMKAIKKKIIGVGRMNLLLKKLRENSEEIKICKSLSHGTKLPLYAVSDGNLTETIKKFRELRDGDAADASPLDCGNPMSQTEKDELESMLGDVIFKNTKNVEVLNHLNSPENDTKIVPLKSVLNSKSNNIELLQIDEESSEISIYAADVRLPDQSNSQSLDTIRFSNESVKMPVLLKRNEIAREV